MEQQHDDGAESGRTQPGGLLCGAVLAALATAGMTAAASALLPSARSGDPAAALEGMLLAGTAALGALLCLYLAVIWSLAGLILIAGPASRTGRTLLAALRVIAPRIARRITLGAVLATTATGLALGPALAASASTDPEEAPRPIAVAAELRPAAPAEAPTESPSGDPAERPQPSSAPEDATEAEDLPPLGWETAPPESAQDTAVPEPTPISPPPPSSPGSSAPPARTITVAPGDSLWSLTDDLVGPGPDSTQDVAAAWPLLYDLNRDRIGDDPELIRPGQELIVPTSLASQEQR